MSEEEKVPRENSKKKFWLIGLIAIVAIIILFLLFEGCSNGAKYWSKKESQPTTQQTTQLNQQANQYPAPPIVKVDGDTVDLSGIRAYFQTGKGLTFKVKLTLQSNEVALVSALRFNSEPPFGQVRILTQSGEYILHDGDIFITSKDKLKNQLVWKLSEFKANPTWALAHVDLVDGVNLKDFGLNPKSSTNIKF